MMIDMDYLLKTAICGCVVDRKEAKVGSILCAFVFNPAFLIISAERELRMVRGLNCKVQARGWGKYTLA